MLACPIMHTCKPDATPLLPLLLMCLCCYVQRVAFTRRSLPLHTVHATTPLLGNLPRATPTAFQRQTPGAAARVPTTMPRMWATLVLAVLSAWCSQHQAVAADTCKEYGCNIPYNSQHTCQCNSYPAGGCSKYSNCCSDYNTTCGSPSPPSPSPPSPSPAHDPSFDHQTSEYRMKYRPASAPAGSDVSVRPFFSPDSSVQAVVDFVDAVPTGGRLDVGTPSFGSWSGLTPFAGCTGGTPADCSSEKFPVFQAILNAIHLRGVTVRLITNNYNSTVCDGKIDPLTFLNLNGVGISWYGHANHTCHSRTHPPVDILVRTYPFTAMLTTHAIHLPTHPLLRITNQHVPLQWHRLKHLPAHACVRACVYSYTQVRLNYIHPRQVHGELRQCR